MRNNASRLGFKGVEDMGGGLSAFKPPAPGGSTVAWVFNNVRAGDDVDIGHVSTDAAFGEARSYATTSIGGTPYGASHVAGPGDDPQPTEEEKLLARALGRRVQTCRRDLP